MSTTTYTSLPILSQSDLAIHIDRFVNRALSTNILAYDIDPDGVKPPRMREPGYDLRYLRQMIDLFDGRVDYDFSENLWLFIDACHDIGLDDLGSKFICQAPGGMGFLDEPHCFNRLVERIRELGQDNRYCRRAFDRRYEASCKDVEVQRYVTRVMDRYARTLVVRVNLYYRSEARLRLKAEDAFADVDRLIKARRRNSVFESVTGYILRVEQGHDQGFHVHAAFFFDGSKVCREFYKAEQIGRLWEDVTCGRGYWHDSGRSWSGDDFERGTGMFHRNDSIGRGAVCKLMTYLTKDTQYLRLRPARARTYRTGRG